MKRRGQLWDTFGGWIIALLVLVIGVGIYLVLSDRGGAALEYFKNLLRFG